MHTAICTFEDRATAQAAVDRLLQAGFDRNDVHLQYRSADGTPTGEEPYAAWDGMEHEVAVSHKVLESFGNFFGRLFGTDDSAGHGGSYSSAVERGHCVVVVDTGDDAEAQRAQSILHGMEAGQMNVVHRSTQPPLREIIAARKAGAMEPDFAPGLGRSQMGAGQERAKASQGGWSEPRTLDVQPDPDDVMRAPGLRYAPDKDKPND